MNDWEPAVNLTPLLPLQLLRARSRRITAYRLRLWWRYYWQAIRKGGARNG